MIRRAKQHVMDQGIMSSPNPKPGKTLIKVTVEDIKSFCNSDRVEKCLVKRLHTNYSQWCQNT